MSYLEKATDLYQQIGTGKTMEAFEQYYAEQCVVIEGDGSVRNGKEEQRQAIQQWRTQVMKEMHDGGVTCITSNEAAGHTTVESWMDVTFADGRRVKFEEVAVQKWEGNQIVHERFYYHIPTPQEGVNAQQVEKEWVK